MTSTSPLIKICGLKTPETIEAAVAAGATHIGLVHFEKSPRHVTLAEAARLRALIPASVKAVVLTVNADVTAMGKIIADVKPDIVQFHGGETPEWTGLVREKTDVEVWKAVGLRDEGTLERASKFIGKIDRFLFDAPAKELPGGNGETFRWELLNGHDHKVPWGLAGGLNAGNVAEAIRATGAELVDTSSGVETAPGVKDVDKIAAFCQAALAI